MLRKNKILTKEELFVDLKVLSSLTIRDVTYVLKTTSEYEEIRQDGMRIAYSPSNYFIIASDYFPDLYLRVHLKPVLVADLSIIIDAKDEKELNRIENESEFFQKKIVKTLIQNIRNDNLPKKR